ncbi:RNA recognition motif 2 [Metarhizium rileyi]|uniref:RNA recognition motif 2 n=1 Tax=Metarhizium rileyi (strain RCEF 4871) TaxID=1649241 RepID=A0A167F7W8_METRR|nr:RNA recognition motif 2 [Metarhizium rileyi RCEF 4871]
MALQHDNTSASPRSSSGIEESLKGTPDTRLKTISPEGTRSKASNFLHVLPLSHTARTSPVTMVASDKQLIPGIGQERDPFVTPRHRTSTRLSPTASSFNPFTSVSSLGETGKANPVATALSNELGLSRCLLVSSDTYLAAEEVDNWLKDLDMRGRRFHGFRSIDTENENIYVRFGDIRDACSTLTTILMSMKSWKVEYCGFIHRDLQENVSDFEAPILNTGQVLLVATVSPSINLEVGQILDIAQSFLHSYGRLFAFIKVQNLSKTRSFKAIAEFCDVSHATKVIANCAHVTTPEIMLRNIPNKVDQAMLKRIIDESSWGKYDFMYLRIDFANDCNVGYAFINFVDPLDIIDFVEARGNQRWNCFKSDKIAEISYATIQGKDCLVQKFRNSSVMLEAPHYRPKLYFTSNGPCPELAGQEEPFPDPDNQSKMKRSCENAEHVGLFTPNAGQHYRDEQRRRRSQYDRGTRLAALEEYDYEAAIQNMYTIPPH